MRVVFCNVKIEGMSKHFVDTIDKYFSTWTKWRIWLVRGGVLLLVLGLGFLMGRRFGDDSLSSLPQQLRMKRYEYDYISPLLACDFSVQAEKTEWAELQPELENHVQTLVSEGKFDKLSVFFRDFGSAATISVRPEDTFFPASLNKVPLMMTVLKMTEEDEAFWDLEIDTSHLTDSNQGQEITPKAVVAPGGRVTVAEAVERMIRHSDNNGFYALLPHLNVETYQQIHNDLRIPYETIDQSFEDFMTAEDYSYFLRVLFSATYLNPEASEQALELLAESDYGNALRAGINPAIPVAHKFGLLTREAEPKERELHDCGIVYYPNNPYLLCVMSKSSLPLVEIEQTIAGISKTVYDYVSQRR